MDNFYRFNSADEDKQIAAEHRDGLYHLKFDTDSSPYTTLLDQVDDFTAYVGKAAVGTTVAQAGWQIKKIVTTAGGSMTVTYADNTAAFVKTWNDRAGYSY